MTVEITKENYESEVKNSDMPVILDFWASWCGPCQMMKPVFEDLSKEYEGKLKFAKVDTEQNTELAQEFSIQGIPCLIVLKKGSEVDRIIGFTPKEEIKAKIDAILEKL